MSSHLRKIFIAGNWKSNGDRAFVNKHCMFLTGARITKNTQLCIFIISYTIQKHTMFSYES